MKKTKEIHHIHFDTIDSTNAWVKAFAHTLDPTQLTCVTALEQTAGRGRFKRKWLSPKGHNLYATLYFCIPKESPYLINLGQVLSLSCLKVLKEQGFDPKIKWPNDILLSEKKVSGILGETIALEEGFGILLGIGINLNMPRELLETIDQSATSLFEISGRTWTLEQILPPLLQQFLQDLALLEKEGFSAFYEKYDRHLAFKGEMVSCFHYDRLYSIRKEQTSVEHETQALKGICHSIDCQGRLNLLLPSGEILPLTSHEIQAES